jgi:hypothetical protein
MISKIEIERRPELDRELPGIETSRKELELTDIVGAPAGDPTLVNRTWMLITEAGEGGWVINRHANTGAEIVAAARRARKFRANQRFLKTLFAICPAEMS